VILILLTVIGTFEGQQW